MKIGVVGVGRLGGAVAERLLRQGHAVGVWNRTQEKTVPLEALGARSFATPAELARESDCVLTLLTDSDALNTVFAGENGLLQAPPGALFVEMSTLPAPVHQAMAKRVQACGSAYLECPVAGSRDAALAGKLLGFAGGSPEDLERARPVLEVLCRRVEHVGEAGAAASVKLAINLPLILYLALLPEALRLVDHLGLDPSLMLDLLADSPGGPNLLRLRAGAIADALAGRSLGPPQSTIAILAKDLRLMLAQAEALGAKLPMVHTALQQIEAVRSDGADGMCLPALLLRGGDGHQCP